MVLAVNAFLGTNWSPASVPTFLAADPSPNYQTGKKFALRAFKNSIFCLTTPSKNVFVLKVSKNSTQSMCCQNAFPIVEMDWLYMLSKNVMTKTKSREMDAIHLAKSSLDFYARLNNRANAL
jgi:hypothetical protein